MTFKKRSWKEYLARFLSQLTDANLDLIYQWARNLQRRTEDGWYRSRKTGKLEQCRLAGTDWGDPIMQESGCAEEFANDFRKRDLEDGCPFCCGDVMENASEPDVMRRWGLR